MNQEQRFTPAEAAALVDLSEKEVRKEIEYKIIDSDSPSKHSGNGQTLGSPPSPSLPFAALVYLYLVRRSSLSLRSQERSVVYRRIAQSMSQDKIPEQIEVADPFYLRLGDGVAFLDDKVRRFSNWKEGLVSDPDVMGGAETFPNSRLTVRHIGEMLERGVTTEEVLEDYPYLAPSDLEFAQLFVRAYPESTVGNITR